MAASKIIPKKSVVSKVPEPTALVLGEIAINYADKIIYGRHPSKSDTDPDAVVALGAPYLHSHDQLVSLDPNTGAQGIYDLELTNSGEVKISNGSTTTTITPPAGSTSRTITFPDKSGTVAFLDDVGGGSGGGEADSLISPDTTKQLSLEDAGTLSYVANGSTFTFSVPESAGTLGLRGGDTIISDTAPPSPYLGLRWIDSSIGRAFDWYIDPDGAGVWVETGVGSDGRQVDIRKAEGYIQWRYTGDTAWTNLVLLEELRGEQGYQLEISSNETHIRWRRVGETEWNDLLAFSQITGPAGSDAEVTASRIQAALGYLPDNPVAPRTPVAHTHDDRYFTEDEIYMLLGQKADADSYALINHGHSGEEIVSGTISLDRLPALPSQIPVVSTGGLANLTAEQLLEINAGTVVITSDGKRQVYKGTGEKTLAANYIELADISPTWSVITEKPSWLGTFNPTTTTFTASQITGLAAVATTNSYDSLINKPAAPVNADWLAPSGLAQILNKPSFASVATSGDYNDLINKPVAAEKTAISSWDAVGRYHYYGTAAKGTATNAATWTIKRIATSVSGAVIATATATGAWDNRANLF